MAHPLDSTKCAPPARERRLPCLLQHRVNTPTAFSRNPSKHHQRRASRERAAAFLGGIRGCQHACLCQIRSKRILSCPPRYIGKVRVVSGHAVRDEVNAGNDVALKRFPRDRLPVDSERDGLAYAHVIKWRPLPVGRQIRGLQQRRLLQRNAFQRTRDRCAALPTRVQEGNLADIALARCEVLPRVLEGGIQGVFDAAQQWFLPPETLIALELKTTDMIPFGQAIQIATKAAIIGEVLGPRRGGSRGETPFPFHLEPSPAGCSARPATAARPTRADRSAQQGRSPQAAAR